MGLIGKSCLTCNQCGFNVLMLMCMQILKDPMYICVPTEYHDNDFICIRCMRSVLCRLNIFVGLNARMVCMYITFQHTKQNIN